jgi:hypothetical protein
MAVKRIATIDQRAKDELSHREVDQQKQVDRRLGRFGEVRVIVATERDDGRVGKQVRTVLSQSGSSMKPGRAHTPIDKVLARIVDNEVQEELHWLVVEPAHFECYRNLWNRFCEEQGAPEHKIGAPQKAEARGGEGPF